MISLAYYVQLSDRETALVLLSAVLLVNRGILLGTVGRIKSSARARQPA